MTACYRSSTCVVGVLAREGGHDIVYVGGDSAGVDGSDLTVRADQKVFANGQYVIGYSGSFRMGQLLRHSFKPPRPVGRRRMETFMTTTFIDAVRECLKKGGYLHVKDGVEEMGRDGGGTFVVGVKGALFEVQTDLQVGMTQDGYVAIGCGAQVANGALFATKGKPARERLLLALSAAERFSAGVRRPFFILKG